ncbi:MAG: HEAT repeat domain-containing protein [Planctomycetes bacterium]|nr:HEAT repeat domain-containing protein [Planctomycetota bacterium]
MRTTPKAERLLAAFRSRKVAERERAIPALASLARPPLPLLRKLAASSAHGVERRCAFEVLQQRRDPSALKLAPKYLRDPYMSVRLVALQIIAEMGGRTAALKIAPGLKDASGGVRVTCATLLGRLRDRRSVPVLLRALRDKKWYVRQAAAEALGVLADPRAARALKRALTDKRACVSNAAKLALKSIAS